MCCKYDANKSFYSPYLLTVYIFAKETRASVPRDAKALETTNLVYHKGKWSGARTCTHVHFMLP